MRLERSLEMPPGEEELHLKNIVLTDTWVAASESANSMVCVWNSATGEVSMGFARRTDVLARVLFIPRGTQITYLNSRAHILLRALTKYPQLCR